MSVPPFVPHHCLLSWHPSRVLLPADAGGGKHSGPWSGSSRACYVTCLNILPIGYQSLGLSSATLTVVGSPHRVGSHGQPVRGVPGCAAPEPRFLGGNRPLRSRARWKAVYTVM